jgi:hypothetical protein
VTSQPYVAGAAIMAGLIVGGAAYSVRHGVGQPSTSGSAAARAGVEARIPGIPHLRLAEWHPPRIPALSSRSFAPAAVPAPTPVVAASQEPPTTRTSPVSSDDGEHQEAGDD